MKQPRDPSFLYAIALGSNRGGPAGSTPTAMLTAALGALDDGPVRLLDASPMRHTDAVGPRQRRYANMVALVASRLLPDEMMQYLHSVEAQLGRQRHRTWGARRIDLDLVLWSEGSFAGHTLVVPHPLFRDRDFVLQPLCAIAPDWHDPLTGHNMRQLRARLLRRKPVDRFRPPH